MKFRGCIAPFVTLTLLAPVWQATAQERRYAEEPTGGVTLPAAGISGEHDATSAVTNPAGLMFLRGSHFGVAVDLADEDRATGSGPGVGFYLGRTLGGELVPRVGVGVAAEMLRPSRIRLDPDPGTPTRLTLASALGLGPGLSMGMSWHRFVDEPELSMDGVSAWDLGLSARVGSRWAGGFVIRDLNTPRVAGFPIQRRYELEVLSRPLFTDQLELGLGGRVGEVRGDVDGWLRVSARITRGLYLKAEALSRSLHIIDTSASGTVTTSSDREYRLSAGLEISLGKVGATTWGSSVLDSGKAIRMRGGTIVLRTSTEGVPSLISPPRRIERVELSGAIGAKAHTRLVLALRGIGRDPRVAGVFVQVDGLRAGWGSIQELRAELANLRKRGKKVYVYMVTGSTREYYLASAANKIYVDPAGGVRLTGFAGTILYFKGLFDKLGVAAQFEKIEEFKSAPETWTRTGPSPPALRMRNQLYDSLYAQLISGIASGRGLSEKKVREILDAGPYTAGELESRSDLVDAVASGDKVAKLVVKDMGGIYPVGSAPRNRPARWSYPAVAVIHVDGDIIDGKSSSIPLIGRKLVGSDTIAASIAAARADRRVKAIVLRIDSPGGSAVASEMMSREVFKTRGVKPIVCSFGDIAASGGYFLAAGCDHIFAEPMTITGSIGIFYGKFDVSKLLTRFGLSWLTFKRGSHSDTETYFRPYTERERAGIKKRLRYYYGRFVKAVAKGRRMKETAVDQVGRGRVWSGIEARKVKLVDQLGGIGDAIRYAKLRAGLGDTDRARVIMLPRSRPSLLSRFVQLPGVRGAAKAKDARPPLQWLPGGAALGHAIPASVLAEPHAAQARLPFTIIWE